ncbi:hypothetical protein [Nannocystis punicea]|uniref:Uncharacterized protein n=1 Tax=Nannocystis punicea TaxID=2995304 RepID=A0ABY7GSB8_9BACT|nr:hypothetical protein [Nannocystis poenicansa]WAS89813.1 hypothetical protein O0S08_26780 [Nannocystis poenicansa]
MFLRVEGVRCLRGPAPEGRLLFMTDGLRFVPAGAAGSSLFAALTDDDDDAQVDDLEGKARFIPAGAVTTSTVPGGQPITLTLALKSGTSHPSCGAGARRRHGSS